MLSLPDVVLVPVQDHTPAADGDEPLEVPEPADVGLDRSVPILDRVVGFGPDSLAPASLSSCEQNRNGRAAHSPVDPALDGEVGLLLDLFPISLLDVLRGLPATLCEVAVLYDSSAGNNGPLEIEITLLHEAMFVKYRIGRQ